LNSRGNLKLILKRGKLKHASFPVQLLFWLDWGDCGRVDGRDKVLSFFEHLFRNMLNSTIVFKMRLWHSRCRSGRALSVHKALVQSLVLQKQTKQNNISGLILYMFLRFTCVDTWV
jgi:hypothetical protein